MFARAARWSPKASLRLEMTRTIVAGRWPEEVLSITAWRLVPLPDIRTVKRIGVEDIIMLSWFSTVRSECSTRGARGRSVVVTLEEKATDSEA